MVAGVEGTMVAVYVLEMGCYEDKSIQGVYASAELAMAAAKGNWEPFYDRDGTTVRWWYNGLDWEEHAIVTPMEVEGA